MCNNCKKIYILCIKMLISLGGKGSIYGKYFDLNFI